MNKVFEKIIEKLEETDFNDIQMVVREVLLKYGFPYESVVQDEVWDALDELSTNKFAKKIVQEVAEEYNGGWIACSERLPEEHETMFAKLKGTDKWNSAMPEKISDDVNVIIEFEDGTRKTKTMHTIDGKWKKDSNIIKFKVIAWQPLPEVYKN